MPICGACGRESEGDFAFCPYCGAELTPEPASREQRKTVTVLFCDVTGSTALGESTDPEALRALLARYFERMKAIVERHGGTVEKFIGDAVMAVFGVPQVHEDDALRGCRTAAEMREALPELGLKARIGVNTGEVVTGTAERLATGDAVNVAARLEQAAQPGDVLLGAETLRLVQDAVEAEAVEPLPLKGKAEPVTAYRLLAVTGEPARRHGAPLVGRRTELRRLRDAFEQAVRDRSCQLFTVLGAAGVGKSRLAAEFLAAVAATVLRGRCLSYGQGITYWPVVEALKQLDTLPSDPAARASLRSLLGESDAATSADEIAWSFRKLLEEQARTRPLVCVFDDVHWAEETFLDLVEHVADLARDAPILLLCMARPDLLDKRPGWGGGKLNATTVLLEPLSAEETDELLDELGGVEGELRARIRQAAEGNPLFVEEMLALVHESDDGEVAVPPTIQALLAARLDQLARPERGVLECGAVEGRVFHRSAVQALAPDEAELSRRLVALVRKELVRPDESQVPGDDAFRFRHLLIRDAAYEALPKATRAELHERFARWLEERGGGLVELEELLGHHLGQAAWYKQELGQPHLGLADRACERLASAGRRALDRGDFLGAISLLERALELTRPARLDVHLELDLARAHRLRRDFRQAEAVAEAAAERAQAAGDDLGEELARVVAENARAMLGELPPGLGARARALRDRLELAGDHAALVHIWGALGQVANTEGRFEEWAEAAERGFRHAQLAGREPTDPLYTMSLALGPRPADAALRALDSTLRENPPPRSLLARAVLLAMLGRLDEAWSAGRDASERLRELTGGLIGGDAYLADVAVCAGDYVAAADYLRRYCDLLEAQGNRNELSTYAPMLGLMLCALGRYEEAEPLAQRGRELGDERDAATQLLWRRAQALVHSSRGEHADAERLAREAVALAERTDGFNFQAGAFCDLADVLAAAGRADDAAEALEQALERYERKRNLAMVAQVRPKLEALREVANVRR